MKLLEMIGAVVVFLLTLYGLFWALDWFVLFVEATIHPILFASLVVGIIVYGTVWIIGGEVDEQ